MQLKVGDYIRFNNSFKQKNIIVNQYEVVQVTGIDIVKNVLYLRNIFGDDFKIDNDETLYKFIKHGKVENKTKLVAASSSNNKNATTNLDLVFVRCVNKMQALASNACIATDSLYLNKLAIAANCITMACQQGISMNQNSRLLQLALKLVNDKSSE